MAACGGTPRETPRPVVAKPHTTERGHLDDPDLNPPPPKKLLSIDWKTVHLTSDADALGLWRQIAPTGADWSDKLDELPDEGTTSTQLALALLHGGNFTCPPTPAAGQCGAPVDVPEPAPTATFDDPCLRRMLAMWSIEQLEDDELGAVFDAFKAIAAIPPPESQLIAAALKAVPETDGARRLELFAIAFAAGHRDLVNPMIGTLEEPQLVEALQKHHIDGALDVLTIEAHRPLYLAAITDEKLDPAARAQAMFDLLAAEPTMPKDVHAAFVTATKSPNCSVAATAARQLVLRGERKLGPSRPRATTAAAMMRAMCVLASYEQQQSADEASFLLGYVPQRGLEIVTVTYDSYSATDDDGDGDPHTVRTSQLVPRTDVTLPELEDLVRALGHCTGTVCKSDDREFRFTFKGDQLTRLEVVERPPCVAR
ncbi:MAG TPA: hypothetical protein VLB44_03540 [Kofleriaceae bacterium]|nr:hypothetical protein [Kofleriaceae bacterium]